MTNMIYKFGPLATVKVKAPADVTADEFVKAGLIKGFAVNDAATGEDVVLVIAAEVKVPFKGSNSLSAGDTIEYDAATKTFDKLGTPTDADLIALQDVPSFVGDPVTVRALLVPGLRPLMVGGV